MNDQLLIDTEFQGLLRPLSEDEYDQLEQNLLETGGSLNPIIIWDEKIVDGHHRYKICNKHDLSYETKPLAAQTRDDVCQWIVKNQRGRRNMTPQELSYARAQRLSSSTPYGQRTAAEIAVAQSSGVSERTVRNDVKFAEDVDRLTPRIRQAVLEGTMKATREQIAQLAEVDPGEQEKIFTSPPDNSSPNIMQLAVPYRRAVLDIQRILRDTANICNDPAVGRYLVTKQTRITSLLREAEDAFRQCEPVMECEDCGGQGCNVCYSTGFISRATKESRDP